MRYAKQKSTGKILEGQGGGNPDNPAHLQTLKDNAISSGIAENDIEVGYADDDVVIGWITTQDEADKTYADRRKEEYDKLNQFELIGEDSINGTTNHRDAIIAIKEKYPKE